MHVLGAPLLGLGLWLVGCAQAECSYATLRSRGDALANPHVDRRTLVSRSGAPLADKKGVMYMNRIGPSGGQLYIANADGSNATALVTSDSASPFDYHANWSPDGDWIVFTSERRGNGQSDLYRIKSDGSGGAETLVDTDSFEDSGVLSPDGKTLAYISTGFNHTANLYVLDIATGASKRLTGDSETAGDLTSPHGFFRPTWSPDGEWLAVTSDRNTDWTGHLAGVGWEHTQVLSIYVIHPDGSGFCQVVSSPGYSLGSPKWSPDGTRLTYYNISRENSYVAMNVWNAHAGVGAQATSQIFTVDVATGLDVVAVTGNDSLVVTPTYIGNGSSIGYNVKSIGISYSTNATGFSSSGLRNPSWSPDGSKVVYEVLNWTQVLGETELFSWDNEWDYRYMDVFPQYNKATNRLTMSQQVLGPAKSSAIVSSVDLTDIETVLNVSAVTAQDANSVWLKGGGAAFQPTWNPDGSDVVVGFGQWFEARATDPGALYRVSATSNGSTIYQNLTAFDSSLNAGFPSYSPDASQIVFRIWNGTWGPLGLHLLDTKTNEVTQLTDGWDNTPGWSPDGERIVFTRQSNWTAEYGNMWLADRFDVYTIKPDGSELTQLTTSNANDAHAVWTPDGRIMWNSGMYGFQDECALYDNTFQPYGDIFIMDADGSNKTVLTDSMWEDAMPQYVLREYFLE
ncbi:tricorn protease N-terminal domain-containing protein [Xylariaceae sp. FL0255]|nr:tricorn protease N-terminal domain-containing protein [Xylariaceae sp. FL0255]